MILCDHDNLKIALPIVETLEAKPLTSLQIATSSLLIAMVSQDVIVLAKLVRTLCPRRVLLFCTPHARAKGWGEKASRLLAGLSHDRPEILGDFVVIDLPDDELAARLETYSRHIDSACDGLDPFITRIDFDCTTGQGIFHVVGFDLLRGIATRLGLEAGAVYCDADTGSILRSTPGAGGYLHTRQPIVFRYAQGQELTERFSIYGVTPHGGKILWPRTAPASDELALRQLYEALLTEPALRGIFHSYLFKKKSWRPRFDISQQCSLADTQDLTRGEIANLADTLSALTGNGSHKEIVKMHLEQMLSNFVGGQNNTQGWRAKYLEDNKLSALPIFLQQQFKSLLRALAPGKVQGTMREKLNHLLMPFSVSLTQTLREQLKTFPKSVVHRNWLEAALESIPVTPAVRDLLLAPNQHIPSLFEDCIGEAMVHLATLAPGQTLAGIFQNVTLNTQERPIAEFDTLVLHENGDIAVVEVKTHMASADLKKIESNIKQVRDFGGAYSTYRLVYPLVASELAALRAGRPEDLTRLVDLGMVDVANWRVYLQTVERSRDQRILGLDQLGELLGSDSGRGEVGTPQRSR